MMVIRSYQVSADDTPATRHDLDLSYTLASPGRSGCETNLAAEQQGR
jgi:hypothetical protein